MARIKPLEPGDHRKRAVRALQRRLEGREGVLLDKRLRPVRTKDGDLKGWRIHLPSGADGVYGEETVRAVKSFEVKNGLHPDGKAGRKVLRRLGILRRVRRILARRRLRRINVITREEWGCPAPEYDPGRMILPARMLVAHCTVAAPPGPDATLAEDVAYVRSIDAYHRSLGWAMGGYSTLHLPSGRVFELRGDDYIGAHTEGHNADAFGCSIASACDPAGGDVTDRALDSVGLFGLGMIRAGRLIRDAVVEGHRKFSTKGKSCPGDYVYERLYLVRRILRRA